MIKIFYNEDQMVDRVIASQHEESIKMIINSSEDQILKMRDWLEALMNSFSLADPDNPYTVSGDPNMEDYSPLNVIRRVALRVHYTLLVRHGLL